MKILFVVFFCLSLVSCTPRYSSEKSSARCFRHKKATVVTCTIAIVENNSQTNISNTSGSSIAVGLSLEKINVYFSDKKITVREFNFIEGLNTFNINFSIPISINKIKIELPDQEITFNNILIR